MYLTKVLSHMQPFFMLSEAEHDKQIQTLLDEIDTVFPSFVADAALQVYAHPILPPIAQLKNRLLDIVNNELMVAYSGRVFSLFQTSCDDSNNPPESCKDKIKLSVYIAPRDDVGFVWHGEYEAPLPVMYHDSKHVVNGKIVNVKRLIT